MDNRQLEFPKLLKQKQEELGLNNKEFAKYIGKTRSWLGYIYGKDLSKTHKLAEYNMIELHDLLGIPLETMLEYNMSIVKHNRGL